MYQTDSGYGIKIQGGGDGTWYDSADLAWRMNEYDEYALEQAVQLKEKTGGDLTVLCIGPERVKETMKKALAMGCDRGVHVVDDASFNKGPFAIASIIAEFAGPKKICHDIHRDAVPGPGQRPGRCPGRRDAGDALRHDYRRFQLRERPDLGKTGIGRWGQGQAHRLGTCACHLPAWPEQPALSDLAQYP